MEFFSHQHHQLAPTVTSTDFQDSIMEMPLLPQQPGDRSKNSCFLPYCCLSEAIPEFSHESSSSFDTGLRSPSVETQMASLSQSHYDKRRKSRDGTCLSLSQAKDKCADKSRKQKQPNGHLNDEGKEKGKQACGRYPAGEYIHVRARRGQATDSHSLAERVRREKISERMKVLQSLVPGCDMVTGKALVLDEIINYVQSLQNQVEFLSMRLTSMNPVFYELGANVDELQKMRAMPHEALSFLGQANHSQHTAFQIAPMECQMMSHSAPLLSPAEGPTALIPQDGYSSWVQVGEQGQRHLNQADFNSMCSFQ